MRAVEVQCQEMLSRLVPQQLTHEASGIAGAGNLKTLATWPDVAGCYLTDVISREFISAVSSNLVMSWPPRFRPPFWCFAFFLRIAAGGCYLSLIPGIRSEYSDRSQSFSQ